MDSGKLAALKKANWKPSESCLTCVHGSFENINLWGLCKNPENNYVHNKHKREHEMPAHFGATCTLWKPGRIAEELNRFLASSVTS